VSLTAKCSLRVIWQISRWLAYCSNKFKDYLNDNHFIRSKSGCEFESHPPLLQLHGEVAQWESKMMSFKRNDWLEISPNKVTSLYEDETENREWNGLQGRGPFPFSSNLYFIFIYI
jgi:hypothetical protein